MTEQQQTASSAATVTTPTDREIHTERVFDERVFAAFTDPELIPEWRGPHGVTTVVDQMHVRPGGAWRFVMHGALLGALRRPVAIVRQKRRVAGERDATI